MQSPAYYFSLDGFAHAELFSENNVWEVLPLIAPYLASHLKPEILGTVMEGAHVSDLVYLGEGAIVEPGAYIQVPAIIGAHSVVRHGAYVRENVITGEHCVIGHATECKNSILFDGAHAAHFNYVGDSILGRLVNLGAGTKLSNYKNDASEISVNVRGERIPSGLLKFGAIIGDGTTTGCNSVISPGTLLGRNCLVYPNIVLRGSYESNSVIKLRQVCEVVERR